MFTRFYDSRDKDCSIYNANLRILFEITILPEAKYHYYLQNVSFAWMQVYVLFFYFPTINKSVARKDACTNPPAQHECIADLLFTVSVWPYVLADARLEHASRIARLVKFNCVNFVWWQTKKETQCPDSTPRIGIRIKVDMYNAHYMQVYTNWSAHVWHFHCVR